MIEDQRAVFEALHHTHEPVALATVIRTQGSMPRHAGSKMLIHGDGSIVGTIGGGAMESLVIQEALAALKDGQTRLKTYTLNNLEDGDPGICGGTADIFIEPLNFAPTLLVIGGGHCGKALAELGKWLGYRTYLSDDRPEFCHSELVPGLAGYLVCKPSEITQHLTITSQTYIACVTRGLPVDLALIPSLLQTSAAYIGVIGSRRRWALTVKALQENHGLTDAELDRIHAPIGLELEAETPQEIALSIMAEIVMIQRGGTGQSMKWMEAVAKETFS
ncbi:MAG: XdhC family protein [Anaerolineae bacterium]|jgi:xanthine dehydrogenase accessory factor|nr:XdhC family protein [Anaerolineae bacterium]